MTDAKTGEIHDYTKRKGVLCTTMHLPDDVPSITRGELWNKAEAAETRKNSTVARECEISLPHELNRETQVSMANEFGAWLVRRHGLAADVSIHEPTKKNDEKNAHAHILMTTRRVSQDGTMGEKCRELDDMKTRSVELLAWRKQWADICNRELEAAGHAERVDHRSNVDRGLEDLPTVHVGNGPRSKENAAANVLTLALNAEIREALQERAQLVAAATIAEAEAMARQDKPAEPVQVVPVPGKDIAAGPLTPAQINALKAPTLDELRKELESDLAQLRTCAEIEQVGRQRLKTALSVAKVQEAKKAAPVAVKRVEKANEKVTQAVKAIEALPWWSRILPFKRRELARSLDMAREHAKAQAEALATVQATAKATPRETAETVLAANAAKVLDVARHARAIESQIEALEAAAVPVPPVQQQRPVAAPVVRPRATPWTEAQTYERPKG